MNEYLKKYSQNFNSVLGFKPTGWTYSDLMCSLSTIKPQISGQVTIYGEVFVDSWMSIVMCLLLINVTAAYVIIHKVNYQQVYNLLGQQFLTQILLQNYDSTNKWY